MLVVEGAGGWGLLPSLQLAECWGVADFILVSVYNGSVSEEVVGGCFSN